VVPQRAMGSSPEKRAAQYDYTLYLLSRVNMSGYFIENVILPTIRLKHWQDQPSQFDVDLYRQAQHFGNLA
jgi:hypothetical protein